MLSQKLVITSQNADILRVYASQLSISFIVGIKTALMILYSLLGLVSTSATAAKFALYQNLMKYVVGRG